MEASFHARFFFYNLGGLQEDGNFQGDVIRRTKFIWVSVKRRDSFNSTKKFGLVLNLNRQQLSLTNLAGNLDWSKPGSVQIVSGFMIKRSFRPRSATSLSSIPFVFKY